MVNLLLITGVVAMVVATAIFLWFLPALHRQRKAAAQHAESLLQTRAHGPGAAPTVIPSSLPTQRWQDILLRANLAPRTSTLLLLASPSALLFLVALFRSGSLVFSLAALLVTAAITAAWVYRRMVLLQREIVAQLPNFLDHIVRIAAVGNSLPMAFQGAAAHTKEPLKPVIEHAQRNTRAGMDIDRALHQAAQAYRVQPLEMVALVMGTSMRIGGRSDQIIQRMSDFMRDMESAQREFNATTSETRMSAIVLSLLPLACGMLMAIANPEFFNPMFEEALGKKILVFALVLEMIGVTLLWRLAKSL